MKHNGVSDVRKWLECLPQELTRHHDKAETQVWELRDKLKDIKTDATTKDKQLDLAKRTVDRLTSEKNRLEVSHFAGEQSYSLTKCFNACSHRILTHQVWVYTSNVLPKSTKSRLTLFTV